MSWYSGIQPPKLVSSVSPRARRRLSALYSRCAVVDHDALRVAGRAGGVLEQDQVAGGGPGIARQASAAPKPSVSLAATVKPRFSVSIQRRASSSCLLAVSATPTPASRAIRATRRCWYWNWPGIGEGTATVSAYRQPRKAVTKGRPGGCSSRTRSPGAQRSWSQEATRRASASRGRVVQGAGAVGRVVVVDEGDRGAAGPARRRAGATGAGRWVRPAGRVGHGAVLSARAGRKPVASKWSR